MKAAELKQHDECSSTEAARRMQRKQHDEHDEIITTSTTKQ
jgi:hypothetical protein